MKKQFLSCDWGTSSFRLRLVDAVSGSIIGKTGEGEGIAAVYASWLKSGLHADERILFYKKKLLEKIKILDIQPDEGTAIFISGMASSSIGMMELPYADLPFKMDGAGIVTRQIECTAQEGGYRIFLFSGARTKNDVMRGEETILLGCDLLSHGEQVAILPGTHSKHAFISAGEMYDIKSYMTGEIFELLYSKSILAGSVSKPVNNFFDKEYFENGVKEGVSDNILNSAFHVRTLQLLAGVSPEKNYHYLSGLLIGTELKEIKNDNRIIHLICSQKLTLAYRSAIELIRVKDHILYTDADEALVAGHYNLAKRLL